MTRVAVKDDVADAYVDLRPLLFSIAYRMLGSVSEAEDVVQEAFVRYQRAMERLYVACIVLSGVALVVITLIIPFGVFMRYAMNKPIGWFFNALEHSCATLSVAPGMETLTAISNP